MKKKYIREELDFVITDLLPLEKSNIYTHRFFYNFLHNEKDTVKKIISDINVASKEDEGKVFGAKWHSAPLTFKIRKNKSFREISLINPIGILECLIYKTLYYEKALSIIHKDCGYGVRIPYHKSTMTLKAPNKNLLNTQMKMKKNKYC